MTEPSDRFVLAALLVIALIQASAAMYLLLARVDPLRGWVSGLLLVEAGYLLGAGMTNYV